jgi:hypothetical protein
MSNTDPDEETEVRVGLYLHASCSAEDYGQIVGVGKDANGAPTIDIEVFHADDLISIAWDEKKDSPPLTRLEVSGAVKLILRDVQYQHSEKYPELIHCKTPGDGCYRCTKLFSLRRTHTEDWKRPAQ